ncbi:breast cancer type 1 susceptibility protein homolog [Pogonomyrmex barbatus]|uniref:RING-type E3 ubiquitin transferase BRCA1 n=1 Tax=Pogonomyrmex barbatus TaxID=144034 RepID=A0A6I9W4T3_9HYME|nr:breast cancer type 1 susceptibility protein homolog [Pogonomyrmex barbatus]
MTDRRTSNIERLSEAMKSLQKCLECTICLEPMTEPTKTRCGHSFCKTCIGTILLKKNVCCPLCKKCLNRRNISKDDHLQTCIEKFNKLVTAIKIDSNVDSKYIPYKATHARTRARNREKDRRSKPEIEEIVREDGLVATNDQVSCAPSTSAITEQSLANWSRVIEIGKEMKRTRRRKVKRLNVSIEKNRKPPRIVEDIRLSPRSRYDTSRIIASHNTSKMNMSNRLEEMNSQKQDAIDNSQNLSDAKASSETKKRTKSFDENKADNSNSIDSTMDISHITLEDGWKIRITNLNNDQVGKIIGSGGDTKENLQAQGREVVINYRDSLPRQRLTVLTPERLNESIRNDEISHDVSQTSADNFESSICSPVKKRAPGPRETNNVQETPNRTASSHLEFLTPKARLSLKRKTRTNNGDSPLLKEHLLSQHEEMIGDHKNVSPTSNDDGLSNRLKTVRRDLSLTITREDQDTISSDARLKNTVIEGNDRNVSRIMRSQDEELGRNYIGESTISTRKMSFSRKSGGIENRGRRSPIKFMQLGTLIRRRNVRYICLGTTKCERSMPAEVGVTAVCNMQKSIDKSEIYVAASPDSNDSQSSNVTVVENNHLANNHLSNANRAVSKESLIASPICKIASATSTPKKNVDPSKSSAIGNSLTNANQRLGGSIKNTAEDNARSFHRTPRADNLGAIHGLISHSRMSNSIKLLSPDKDSQLKFLEIDSPMSERELRRVGSTKSAIKENNFSEMKSSRLAASTSAKAQEPFVESPNKNRKRMRCANDRELSEEEFNDGCDSDESISSQSTIKNGYIESSKKSRSDRLDTSKKRRLSSSDDQDVIVISSVSEEQNASERKSKTTMPNSDSEMESATRSTKNLSRHNDEQCDRGNAPIINTRKCLVRQDSDENLRIRSITDKWRNEHDAMQKKLMREGENSQNSVTSTRQRPSEENLASQRSSTGTFETEKHKSVKSCQKSPKESMFESNSLFSSTNIDYMMQQLDSKDNMKSQKATDPSNDDTINRVLDRSESNLDSRRPSGSTSQKDMASQREKNSRENLLQDNFDEIIASVEQSQSEDVIPCTEQLDRNPNRPLAEQKSSNCLAMTDELYRTMQDSLIIPASSTTDMFEHHSSKNVRKPYTRTNIILRNSDKENVASNIKKRNFMNDQRDREGATASVDAIDKDSHKKIVSKYNASQEKGKSEERNVSIRLTDVDDNEGQRATAVGNESSSKNDVSEQDSLMNITQHQVQLQMFEEDLFGITDMRNQMRTTSQSNLSQQGQRTPKRRKQNIQGNTTPGEHLADEDDVVENTPEKKMKNNGNNVKAVDSREKMTFLSPIPKAVERTSSISGSCQTIRSSSSRNGANTPTDLFGMYPSAQSTPMLAHNTTTMNRANVSGGNKRSERVESSGSVLLAKQLVDGKTLENVRRQPDRQDLCFVCSGLSAAQIATVKEFAAKYNASYVNQFDRNVTHVVVKTTGEQNAARSTLKYLQGIAHRKWIVSYRWIEDCTRQQKLLNEVAYEATTYNDSVYGAGPRNSRLRDKGLFEGFTFLCVGPYDNVSLEQYQDLLLAIGATVVDSFEILAKMGGMKGIVIQDNVHDNKVIEHWYRTTKAAPILVDWIVECIGHYRLFKLTSYINYISPQDFCAIGYPRELVEEEEEEEYSDDE